MLAGLIIKIALKLH